MPRRRGAATTIHCGPDGLYVNALGNPEGDGPGGIFILDCESFDVRGRWEVDRGPQELAYDFWWHLVYDTLLSSEWGTPKMVENGVVPEFLLGKKYGHRLHGWDLRKRRHVQALALARRRAPDGARAPARPRSDQGLRAPRRGGQRRRLAGVDLDLG